MAEEEKKVRKKTTKKTAQKILSTKKADEKKGSGQAKKTTRKVAHKTAAKKIATKTLQKESVETPSRKAPTEVADRLATEKRTNIIFYSGLSLVFILLAASVTIGVMGKGSITISSVIQDQKEVASPDELEKINSIPVHGTKKRLPNGGLTPTPNNGKSSLKKEIPVATTTGDVASSTDLITNEQETEDITEPDEVEKTETEPVVEPDAVISDEEI